MNQISFAQIRNAAVAMSVIAGTLAPGTGHCQEPADSEKAYKRFEEEAAEYQFRRTDSNSVLQMQKQSLLHWSNPARNGENGAVFLWTDQDVPIVVGTCFTFTYAGEERRKHAFHILSNTAIQGSLRGRVFWTPPANGVTYSRRTDAPSPGPPGMQRNRQLRQLARNFQVILTQKNGRKEQCRLIPQPLYQFESKDGNHAGAIFSFAVGTDPEALLLLNIKDDKSGVPTWHYSFVRFTFYALEAKLNDAPAWKVEKSESLRGSIFARPDYQREPYVTFRPELLE